MRVLDAAGAPARNVRVGAHRDVNLGFWPAALAVDGDGRVVLKACAPGAHRPRVYRDTELLCEQELLATPGLNPEVEVRLPALERVR